MTLIEVRNSDGVVGRCNEACYAAQHPDCDCVCHGRNHGVGLSQAVDNTREMIDHLVAEYQRDGQAIELNLKDLIQIPLFSD